MTTETNVERLERISKTDLYMYDRSGKHVTVSSEDFDWLIQRSERAQEMEKQAGNMMWGSAELAVEKRRLEIGNARLREALQSACNSLGADIEDYLSE